MANKDEPRGFWPASARPSVHYYTKGATAIYPGDLVVMNSGGKVTTAAAGGTQILGVAAAYRTAASTDTIPVYDDPDQQFWVQDDGVGGTLAQTNIGVNMDVVATVGHSTFLKSQMEADTSSQTFATAQLRLLGFDPSDEIGKNVRCRVVINEHLYAKKLGGAV